MGKKQDPFRHLLKTFDSIEQKIEQLIAAHRDIKAGKLGAVFRVVIDPNSATIYEKGHHGKGELRDGV